MHSKTQGICVFLTDATTTWTWGAAARTGVPESRSSRGGVRVGSIFRACKVSTVSFVLSVKLLRRRTHHTDWQGHVDLRTCQFTGTAVCRRR